MPDRREWVAQVGDEYFVAPSAFVDKGVLRIASNKVNENDRFPREEKKSSADRHQSPSSLLSSIHTARVIHTLSAPSMK